MLRYLIKDRLEEKNRRDGTALSWADVAQATGISRQVLSTLANTTRAVVTNTAHLESLGRYFRCPFGQLIDYAEPLDDLPECRIDVLYPERRLGRREGGAAHQPPELG